MMIFFPALQGGKSVSRRSVKIPTSRFKGRLEFSGGKGWSRVCLHGIVPSFFQIFFQECRIWAAWFHLGRSAAVVGTECALSHMPFSVSRTQVLRSPGSERVLRGVEPAGGVRSADTAGA